MYPVEETFRTSIGQQVSLKVYSMKMLGGKVGGGLARVWDEGDLTD